MDTTEQIKPALTAEEWALWVQHRRAGKDSGWFDSRLSEREEMRLFVDERDGVFRVNGDWGVSDAGPQGINIEERHALAALALHGQPFGFTPDDLNTLYLAAEAIEVTGPIIPSAAIVDRLARLADRINALLPPE